MIHTDLSNKYLLSIVIPVYNEEKNILPLLQELLGTLQGRYDFEVIIVDDGSQDKGAEIIRDACRNNARVRAVFFQRNYGQTAALSAGFQCARGKYIIPLDADLQNDPASIPGLVSKALEGYDVVSGWRKKRKDKLLTRKIPSWIANFCISRITGVKLHDFGCTLKVYSRQALEDIKLYGEMHRMIPAYVFWRGGKITEVGVNHRPRVFGETKYGISRTLKVVLDLFTVKFFISYSARPIHFFGAIGAGSLGLSAISFVAAFLYKFSGIADLTDTPLLLITALFFIVGIQFILMGILAEILIRTYFESTKNSPYKIKETINIEK